MWVAWVAWALLVAGCASGRTADEQAFPSEHLVGGVVVYGDSRTGHAVHAGLVADMALIAPAAVVHTGDLVENGYSDSDWAMFDSIRSLLPPGTPFYAALGNHEGGAPAFFERFGQDRWHAEDIDTLHLVILDTGSSMAVGSSQYLWLESHLAALDTQAGPIVVAFHYPPYTTGEHTEDEMGLQGTVVPLFERHGVDLVASGHQHNYERSTVNGVRYVVTGGGGAPLHGFVRESAYSEVRAMAHHFCVLWFDDGGSLWLDAIDDGGDLIDRFEIGRN